MFNIQARAPTEAVIPKYVQPKTILSLDVPSDLNLSESDGHLLCDSVAACPSEDVCLI